MSFLSLSYFVALPVAVGAYYLLPHRYRSYLLLAYSIGFYLLWNVYYAFLLIALAWFVHRVVLFVLGAPEENRKFKAVVSGVIGLVLILCFFKYFTGWSKSLLDLAFQKASLPALPFQKILVPLGLSYYVFKLISYVLDCYWEKIPPSTEFVPVLLYTSFFPQIQSGPIQRSGDFLEQLGSEKRFNLPDIEAGIGLILWGLFKKLVVADRIGVYVDIVHKQPGDLPGMMVLAGLYLYPFQLYADFSGMTDMAIGSARLFGFNSPDNFNSPYRALNIPDFWRRWHITLTEWLRDYVFIPLRMSMREWGQAGIIISLIVNNVAIGVWHGANMTFLTFGLIQGAYIIGSFYTLSLRESFYQKMRCPDGLRKGIARFVTFHLVLFSFVFFRAPSMDLATDILKQVAVVQSIGLRHVLTPLFMQAALWITLVFIVFEVAWKNRDFIRGKVTSTWSRFVAKYAFYGVLVAAIVAAGNFDGSSFIYNQF